MLRTLITKILTVGIDDDSPGYVHRPVIFTNMAAGLGILFYTIFVVFHLMNANPSLLPVTLIDMAGLACLPFVFLLNKNHRYSLAAVLLNLLVAVPVFIKSYLYYGYLTGYHIFFIIFTILPILTMPAKRMFVTAGLVGLNLAFYLLTFRHLPLHDVTSAHSAAEMTAMNYAISILVILLMAVCFYIYQVMLAQNDHNLERKADELRLAYDEVNLLASTDPLTGLLNRRVIEQTIMDEIIRAERYHSPLSIILFDLDHFKTVNDTFGHDIGDQVLITICSLVQANLRETDVLGRWGGEEFLIILPETDVNGATRTAEKLRAVLAKHKHETAGKVTASFGVVQRQINTTLTFFFRQVDEAMYAAKNQGRNRVWSAPHSQEVGINSERLEWKAEWETGLAAIDDEHKALVVLTNQFIEASLDPDHTCDISALMHTIYTGLSGHFTHEEKILADSNYPDTQKHIQIHGNILRKLIGLENRIEAGEVRPVAFYIFIINEIVVGHMLNSDIKYYPHIRRYVMNS
jgi:diguanylate cyclase (GGDEF)-like protein/hemerythrin-like metal-binding protein